MLLQKCRYASYKQAALTVFVHLPCGRSKAYLQAFIIGSISWRVPLSWTFFYLKCQLYHRWNSNSFFSGLLICCVCLNTDQVTIRQVFFIVSCYANCILVSLVLAICCYDLSTVHSGDPCEPDGKLIHPACQCRPVAVEFMEQVIPWNTLL